jgi:hypothetical protein
MKWLKVLAIVVLAMASLIVFMGAVAQPIRMYLWPGFVAASNASLLDRIIAPYHCDGVDDEVEIEASGHSMPDFIGGTIHLSAGTFICRGTGKTYALDINDMNKPISLEGSGFLSWWPVTAFYPAGTEIRLADGANRGLLNYGYNTLKGTQAYWSCGEITNIWFNGNRDNNPSSGNYGVLIKNRGDVIIQHCMFNEFNNDIGAINLAAHGCWMIACDIEDISGTGIFINSTRNWIDKCHLARFDGDGGDAAIGFNNSQANNSITNCNIQDCNDKCINTSTSGTGAVNVKITGCTFYNWAIDTAETAIRLRANDANWIITDNFFNGNSVGNYAIYSTADHDRITITNNPIQGTTTPISMSGTLTNSIIKDNPGADTTLTATGNAQRFEITHLAPSSTGQTATLPDGYLVGGVKVIDMTVATYPMVLTVTHDANAAGGASNYTFDDANDFAEFRWNGHLWKIGVNTL